MRGLALLLPALLCAAAAVGADFSGIWVGQMPGRNRVMQDVAFKFTQNGTALEGKLYGDYRSTPISDAVISGDLLTFIVTAQEQSGNQINQSRIRFTGRMQDGELELTRERESSTNAGNRGGVQIRDNSKQTFHLKRLL